MGAPKGLVLAADPAGDAACPPPLQPVANRPILHHALHALARAGVREAGIVVSPEVEPAIRASVAAGGPWDLRVVYLEDPAPDGLGSALRAGQPFLGSSPFVLQRGDGLLRGDLRPLVAGLGERGPDATVLVYRPAARGDGRVRPANGRSTLHALVAAAGGGVAAHPGLALAGTHLFGPRFLARAAPGLHARHGPSDVAALAGELRRAGGDVQVALVRGWRRYGGDVRDLLELNRLVLDELEDEPVPADLPDVEVQGRVSIHPEARVESAVLRGPVAIGAHAQVLDAYVGPYTSIGEGAHVEGVEIEHSIVLPEACIRHVGGRLEASLIGRGAAVVREFRMPQALTMHIGDGARVSLP
jgi:glucose-1-phosphate thymidylyltransferase